MVGAEGMELLTHVGDLMVALSLASMLTYSRVRSLDPDPGKKAAQYVPLPMSFLTAYVANFAVGALALLYRGADGPREILAATQALPQEIKDVPFRAAFILLKEVRNFYDLVLATALFVMAVSLFTSEIFTKVAVWTRPTKAKSSGVAATASNDNKTGKETTAAGIATKEGKPKNRQPSKKKKGSAESSKKDEDVEQPYPEMSLKATIAVLCILTLGTYFMTLSWRKFNDGLFPDTFRGTLPYLSQLVPHRCGIFSLYSICSIVVSREVLFYKKGGKTYCTGVGHGIFCQFIACICFLAATVMRNQEILLKGLDGLDDLDSMSMSQLTIGSLEAITLLIFFWPLYMETYKINTAGAFLTLAVVFPVAIKPDAFLQERDQLDFPVRVVTLMIALTSVIFGGTNSLGVLMFTIWILLTVHSPESL